MIVVFGSINTDLIIETPALPRPDETVLAPGYRVLPGGENQIVVAFGAEASWRIGALGVEARDTARAGDAFVGVLAAALDDGAAIAETLGRASVAASLARTGIGARQSLPDNAMIEARLGDIAPARRTDG